MQEELKKIKKAALEAMEQINSVEGLNELKVKFLGKKGELTGILKGMGKLDANERPLIGQLANEVRDDITRALEEKNAQLKKALLDAKLSSESIDITLPGRVMPVGSKHPLTLVIEEAKQIFIGLGFNVAEGPEIESDYYNFEALNLPKDHPARDMQDTFYISPDTVSYTHLIDRAGAGPAVHHWRGGFAGGGRGAGGRDGQHPGRHVGKLPGDEGLHPAGLGAPAALQGRPDRWRGPQAS